MIAPNPISRLRIAVVIIRCLITTPCLEACGALQLGPVSGTSVRHVRRRDHRTESLNQTV